MGPTYFESNTGFNCKKDGVGGPALPFVMLVCRLALCAGGDGLAMILYVRLGYLSSVIAGVLLVTVG